MPTATATEIAPPHNLESERALLGSILLDVASLETAQKTLTINSDGWCSDFYSPGHRLIFRKMLKLAEVRGEFDVVTLSESLMKDGNLDKAGGAAYLSALTDGVPIGATVAVSEYCRIIRDKSLQRRIIETANNLMARAASGLDSADDLVLLMKEQATELHATALGDEKLEEARAAAEKAAVTVRLYGDYPTMPKEAWYGASEIYRQAVAVSTNASHNYHLAAFLTVAGILFGKSIVTEEAGDDYFPNLFTVVVGRAGAAHKDTAVSKAVKLARALDEFMVLIPKISSWEGFVTGLQTEQKELEKKEVFPPLHVLIRLRELKTLIAKAAQKATSNVMSELCELYDVPEELTSPTKNDRALVKQPIAAVVAATSPGWLRQLSLDDLEAGVGSRFVFCPGDPGPRLKKRQKPLAEFMNPLMSMMAQRIAEFRAAGKTVFEFTATAKARIDKWAEAHEGKRSGNDLIDCLTARDEANCRKVALIHAALDGPKPIIDLPHVDAAIAYIEFLYESRFPIFAGQGMTPAAEIDEKILKRVQDAGVTGMPYREIRRGLQRISHEEFERHMKSLTTGNEPPLKLRQIGKKLWVWTAYTVPKANPEKSPTKGEPKDGNARKGS